MKHTHVGARPSSGKLVNFFEPQFPPCQNNNGAPLWVAMRLKEDRAQRSLPQPRHPHGAGMTDEETGIITRKQFLRDPHQQAGLKSRSASPKARGILLLTPHHLSQLTNPHQRTVAIKLKKAQTFYFTWFKNTFTFLGITSLLLGTDGSMHMQPSASKNGSCEDSDKRQRVVGGRSPLGRLSVEHPRKEVEVLAAYCSLDFPFIETTSIGYLIQAPGNLSPVPDPTDPLGQLIAPDPVPRDKKRFLSSLASLWGEVNLFTKLDPGRQH